MTTIIRQNLSVKSCGAAANMTGKMTLTLSAYAALPVSPQYGCPPAVLLDTDHVTQGCMFYSKGHRRIHYAACQINIFPAGQDPEWGGAQKKHNVKEISRTPRLKTQPRVMKQHRFRTKRKFLLCESVPVDYIGQPRFQIHPFHRAPAYSPPLGIPRACTRRKRSTSSRWPCLRRCSSFWAGCSVISGYSRSLSSFS